MKATTLYPLRFEPIYQYRLWGGRRLTSVLTAPLPGTDPIGEAWLLSDRAENASCVADGSLKGKTITQLLEQWPVEMFGKLAGKFNRFPLLLKFLDARDTLSVQVHPSDQQTQYLPPGETGKTEAWVVLEAGSSSRIYAGLMPGTTPANLQESLARGTVTEHLASFTPQPGDAVLISAGTVHALSDTVVFEIQENSDVTFRLYDWDHVDAKTGKPRPLQVEQAMACIDFTQGALRPVTPIVEEVGAMQREQLVACDHFGLWRLSGDVPFVVGVAETPRVLVCIAGEAQLEYSGADYAMRKGDVMLLPAEVGACVCRPVGALVLFEMSLPERT